MTGQNMKIDGKIRKQNYRKERNLRYSLVWSEIMGKRNINP